MAQAIRVLFLRCWQAIKQHDKGRKSLTGMVMATGREEGSEQRELWSSSTYATQQKATAPLQ